MDNPQWSAEQYLRFARERTQPSRDLAARIPLENPAGILDVGCGPGNSTQVLHERFPAARLVGIDNSPEMIAAARAAHPEFNFQVADANRERAVGTLTFDIVFANASLQWIPAHQALLPRLLGWLRPGGVLAVQVPEHWNSPAQQIIADVAALPEWQSEFPAPEIFFSLRPAEYFDLLAPLTAELNLWETTYHHPLRSYHELLEWYDGSVLRSYLQALPEDERPRFAAEVLDRLKAEYPQRADGTVVLPIARLFFVAVRGD